MSGETNLNKLLAGLSPRLTDEIFVFVTLSAASYATLQAEPLMMFHEEEGVTVILPEERAKELGLKYIFPCRRITLQIHSSLEAVGMMAAVAMALAKVGIGCNPVAGFHHDHLFVASDKAEEALSVLKALAARM